MVPKFRARYLGIIIIILGILVILFVNSFSGLVGSSGMSDCSCGMTPEETCEAVTYFAQFMAGYAIAGILMAMGVLVLVFLKTSPAPDHKMKWNNIIKKMAGEERKVYETLTEADGVMFQSELVEKTGMNKVKVSRILDKMEARGLLERKRRGMSNAVVLK
ncbi:MAG: MarR family transcriptional regulator [Candidatus Aenigmarchaeota archaeon]|nr:MarR family transcriptional regulator [Candidatus Aenigmarchaeota archaeon]